MSRVSELAACMHAQGSMAPGFEVAGNQLLDALVAQLLDTGFEI